MSEVVVTERLGELEAAIGRGLETFVEVGRALMEIRDAGLYRDSYSTFEDYCDGRWQLKRRRAYELMEASQATEVVSEISHTAPPLRESHAAALLPLRDEPEEMAAAWAQAHSDGDPTAAKVREAVQRRVEPGRGFTGYSSATDEWTTPQDLFDTLNAEFKFDLDVCALPSSAKCKRYFSPEDDGLAQKWKGTCWMNPPYGDVIKDWVAKALESAGEGATIVCLVPARVDTGWWFDNCRWGEIRFIRGRLKFGESTMSAPFPSAVVVFGPGFSPKVKWWER